MQPPRLFTVLLLLTGTLGWAITPADTSTVCDRYQHSDVTFTGTAETVWITMLDTRKSPIHRRAEKSKRVRFLVREWYKGKRADTVEVWMTPGECEFKIEADQTYLIYARFNKDADKGKGRFESNGCMGTVPVAGAAADLTYLTAVQLGPRSEERRVGED